MLTQREQLKLAAEFFGKTLPEVEAELPFKLLPDRPISSEKIELVGGFQVPKLSELTQAELFCWNEFVEPLDLDSIYMATAELVAATLILKFRVDVNWSVGETFKLTPGSRRSLYQFFDGERRGWIEPTPIEADAVEEEAESPTPKLETEPSGQETSGDSSEPTPVRIVLPAIDLDTVEAVLSVAHLRPSTKTNSNVATETEF